MKLDRICLFILACLIPAACADLDYSEENTRDEEWTYEYFENGIKNMVFDLYAQVRTTAPTSSPARPTRPCTRWRPAPSTTT